MLSNTDNWLSGFPKDGDGVMWQLTSDEFLLYHDGFFNAAAQASAYPLCKKSITPVPGVLPNFSTNTSSTFWLRKPLSYNSRVLVLAQQDLELLIWVLPELKLELLYQFVLQNRYCCHWIDYCGMKKTFSWSHYFIIANTWYTKFLQK